MQTVSVHKPKVQIITLGCAKNIVDSEHLGAQLHAADYLVSFEEKTPLKNNDIIIINTCGFIEKAKQESINTILHYAQLKTQGKVGSVYVMGCLSERYKTELQEAIPEVDAFFGTMEQARILHTLRADYKKELLGERLLSLPAHYAYLKISEGCNRKCSFCAIPSMRGKHISVPMELLVMQAEKLVQSGVKEIILIAQELTYYGLDIYKKRRLPELLEKLARIKGLHWIRLHYAYPAHFPLEIIEVMKAHPNICPYLDMPLQHASDAVLKRMKRGISRAKTEQLLCNIRKILPNITLRTTFLIGFPGETEEDIVLLKNFIQEQRLDRVGVFTYSHEEGTSAYENYANALSEEEKQARAEEIMNLQSDISLEKNTKKIGEKIPVLIDNATRKHYIGRTVADSPEVDNEVYVSKDMPLHAGNLVQVRIQKADAHELYGTPLHLIAP